MPENFQAKVAHFVEITAAALGDATTKLAAADAARQAYTAKVAAVVDELIANNFMKAASREVAIQKLSNPEYALEQIVKLAAGHVQEETATSSLGTAVPATNAPATAKKAGRRGAHWEQFVRNQNLDPAAL
jgi:hypothetical protein